MKTIFVLLTLLLSLASAALANYSPDILFVKMRSPVRVSALDSQLSTWSTTVNQIVSTGAMADQPLAQYSELSQALERIVRLQFSGGQDLETLASQLSSDPEVEWVAFNNRYSTGQSLDDAYVPIDSLYPDAWWLEKISAGLAWEITRGDTSIVIGIIDTGVDYTHRDLRSNIWHNRGEIPENGIDDDRNGFIDDVIGWDFVDAPSLPAGGDYLVRDNDPMDDFGHGTYVAGCASAESDNPDCFPSIGFNCRIMPLRAGNSRGTLEEDDIAAAILYGTSNGVAIINMSFGDVVASPLLREVVTIAHDAGVVLVASAGNATDSTIHYPSGFREVIAVGATDSHDRKANFSNYGPSVDVMAPGVDIGSTILGGECGLWDFPSGTSYASPLVAGLVGLILSVNPSLSPDDVLNILKSSADDIYTDGWDSLTANGRVNARRAIESAAFGADAEALILSPATDSGIRGSVAIIGNVQGTAFSDYTLEYGLGENPQTWNYVASGTHRILNDTLGVIQAPTLNTVLVVRLTSRATTQHQSVDMSHVYVQTSPPTIDSMRTRTVLDGPGFGLQIRAWSNQFSCATLLMTNASGDSVREDFGYVGDEHVAIVLQSRYQGEWRAVLQITNLMSESVRSEPFSYSSVQNSIRPYLYNSQATSMTHGIVGAFTSDYNCNGMLEVWMLPVDENNIVDTLEAYEWNGSDFVETENTYGPHIPQCFGDADGDGLLEMGARRFGESRVWEQTDSCSILNNLVFESPDSFSQFLISRFVRLDSTSNREAILARSIVDSVSQFVVFEISADYSPHLLSVLPNETDGLNSYGPPTTAVGDVDDDGLVDIFFGDYDGDVVWCEWTGSQAVQVWSTRLPQNDATSWLTIGDFDCDGQDELVAGCRSNAGAPSESQRLLMGWDYYIFESNGNNELSVVDSIAILGNENVTPNPASVAAHDVNEDGCDDILISAYPDFYIVTRDQQTGRYIPEWHAFPSKAGGLAVADFNHNGINEILMSDGSQQVRIENAVAMANAPYPPVLSGFPLDESRISLSWSRVTGAVHYEVYYAQPGHSYELLTFLTDTTFAWDAALTDTVYRFAVATYDTTFEQPISVYSNILELSANTPPSAQDTALHAAPKTIAVTFNEPMSSSVFVQGNWRLADGSMPAVIAENSGMRIIYLTFDTPFPPGEYQLMMRNLRDAQGTPLPASEASVVFTVVESQPLPAYVTSHHLVDAPVGNHVQIEFSEPMSENAVANANYSIVDPRLNDVAYPSTHVEFENPEHTRIVITLNDHYPAGAVGVEVRINISGISAQSGSLLEATSLLISESASNLDQAYVYPNPFRGRGAAGTDGVYFAALPQSAVIRIFTLDGVLVRKIQHDGATGHAEWDLQTQDGEAVASGIYLFQIESDGDEIMGKLAVVR
ncbi:MAG: S8 family serine peptidase [bacterium]|nr:S8 family serine peptidase [bacterium]